MRRRSNIAAVKVAREKPFDEGVHRERKQFMKLMIGTQSAAQRYFFFAERKANKIDGIAGRHRAARRSSESA